MTNETRLNVISIDPPGAREIDDAISARATDYGWHVDVCVPDVPALLKQGSQEDIEARKRGMTTYTSDAIRKSMLPPHMVDKLSLSPKEDRPIIHIEMTVTPNLECVIEKMERKTGRTLAQISYKEADNILADSNHQLHRPLADLWDLTARLQQERSAATGAVFNLEQGIITDEEGRQIQIDKDRAHKGNLIVMEMMILTNSALAAHASLKNKPILFRNHRLEGFDRGDRTCAAREIAWKERIGETVAKQKLKTLGHLVRQAELSTTSLGHFGLDTHSYAWFTSPLRRYVDIVNLRVLLENIEEPEIENLASRYTGLYRQKQDDSSEHHARMRRKEIVAWISSRNNENALDQYDVHTIIRALREATESFDRLAAGDYIGKRLQQDKLSGRDIDELLNSADQLFNSETATHIREWADASARQALLQSYRDGIVQPVSEPSSKTNFKGYLLERATQLKANVEFHPAERSGPSHAGVFTVRVTWKYQGTRIETVAQARTIKNAEHAAAEKILKQLDRIQAENRIKQEKASRTTYSASQVVEKAPKNILLELIQKTPGASIDFGVPTMSGPAHMPVFNVNVTVQIKGQQIIKTGTGKSRKEAERNASELILEELEGMSAE